MIRPQSRRDDANTRWWPGAAAFGSGVIILAACGARTGLEVSGSVGGSTGILVSRSTSPATTADSTSTSSGLPHEEQAILDSCVVAASCGELHFPYESASACVDGFSLLGWSFTPGPSLPNPIMAAHLRDCAANAHGDCAAFRACFGGDAISLGAWFDGSCIGNVATGTTSFDCAAIGGTCRGVYGVAAAYCDAPDCSDASSPMGCTGTVATFCTPSDQRVTFDCGPSGRTCQIGIDGISVLTPPCVGTGAPCTNKTLCTGEIATYCSGGRTATFDCSSTKFRTACDASGDGWGVPICKPKGFACHPIHDVGGCAGTHAQVCADGEWATVDCQALGFSGCENTSKGPRCTS